MNYRYYYHFKITTIVKNTVHFKLYFTNTTTLLSMHTYNIIKKNIGNKSFREYEKLILANSILHYHKQNREPRTNLKSIAFSTAARSPN